MRILLHEYLTGGGMAGKPLPPELAAEGELMVRALADDLAALAGVTVRVSRDDRLSELPGPIRTVRELPDDDERHWREALAGVDAAWIIAPETDGRLESLCRRVAASGTRLIGCSADAVEICASKRDTERRLSAAGVPCVPTFSDPQRLPAIPGPWVVKPDDGCACEGARLLPDRAAAGAWLRAHAAAGWIAQPWTEGRALSLSLAIDPQQRLTVLTCNEQHIRLHDGAPHLAGLSVGLSDPPAARFEPLAQAIRHAIPGLAGYFGVDFLLTADGPLVLEINPRLTTAWCGLRRALGINPAAVVLGLPQPAPPNAPCTVAVPLQGASPAATECPDHAC